MIRLVRILSLLLFVTLALATRGPASATDSPALDQPAPNFVVESGDNRKLSLNMLRGRVVVLFYESRHVIRKNIELKNELKKLYREQPDDVQKEIFRLVVIDCAEACLPTLPIWKNQLQQNSQKEGFTIYADWSRKMFKDYRMKPEDSNFLIIDKQGIIKYLAAGKIDRSRFDQIKDLLFSLVQAG